MVKEFQIEVMRVLKLVDGDAELAVRLLTNLVRQEPGLLLEAVEPFLDRILLQAVKQASDVSRGKAKSKTMKAVSLSSTAMKELVDQLATTLPVAKPRTNVRYSRTAADALTMLGYSPDDYPPPKAGEKHQAALRAMARSFQWLRSGSRVR